MLRSQKTEVRTLQYRSGAKLDSSQMGSGGRKWLAVGFSSGDPSKCNTFTSNAP